MRIRRVARPFRVHDPSDVVTGVPPGAAWALLLAGGVIFIERPSRRQDNGRRGTT